jgi:hypothetical protein
MNWLRAGLLLGAVAGGAGAPVWAGAEAHAQWQCGSMAGASFGIGASLNGAEPFAGNNAWNTDMVAAIQAPVSRSFAAGSCAGQVAITTKRASTP